VAAGDLVELWGRHPAPLRAWVKLDREAGGREIALDGLGRRILGVAPGDAVEIRALPMPPVPGGLAS
jgi:N-methylhydantoinase B